MGTIVYLNGIQYNKDKTINLSKTDKKSREKDWKCNIKAMVCQGILRLQAQ